MYLLSSPARNFSLLILMWRVLGLSLLSFESIQSYKYYIFKLVGQSGRHTCDSTPQDTVAKSSVHLCEYSCLFLHVCVSANQMFHSNTFVPLKTISNARGKKLPKVLSELLFLQDVMKFWHAFEAHVQKVPGSSVYSTAGIFVNLEEIQSHTCRFISNATSSKTRRKPIPSAGLFGLGTCMSVWGTLLLGDINQVSHPHISDAEEHSSTCTCQYPCC